jgi:hypothetical protein
MNDQAAAHWIRPKAVVDTKSSADAPSVRAFALFSAVTGVGVSELALLHHYSARHPYPDGRSRSRYLIHSDHSQADQETYDNDRDRSDEMSDHSFRV